MLPVFVEFPCFTEVVNFYFRTDENYRKLQEALAKNPQKGDVVQNTGGIRKLRWPDPSRGKGKRSGLRVLYLSIPEFEQFLMIDVYNKDEQDDLSPEQRKRLTQLVAIYRRILEGKATK